MPKAENRPREISAVKTRVIQRFGTINWHSASLSLRLARAERSAQAKRYA